MAGSTIGDLMRAPAVAADEGVEPSYVSPICDSCYQAFLDNGYEGEIDQDLDAMAKGWGDQIPDHVCDAWVEDGHPPCPCSCTRQERQREYRS